MFLFPFLFTCTCTWARYILIIYTTNELLLNTGSSETAEDTNKRKMATKRLKTTTSVCPALNSVDAAR